MEISRDIIQQRAATCVDDFCERKKIENMKDAILFEVSAVLDLLPEEVAFPEMLNRRCCAAAANAADRFQEEHGVEAALLEELKLDIRAEANLLLLQERIQEALPRFLGYCASHKVPRRWGLGSVETWKAESGENLGGNFLQFWQRNIEKRGDEKFRREILPRLPEEWQANYRTRNRCPHDWAAMDHRQIAEVLENLQWLRDPAASIWGLGSVENWVSGSGGRYGKSYCNYLSKTRDGDADGYFRMNILPLLPGPWQGTYETKDQIACPHKWRSMSHAEIAGVLGNLKQDRNPAGNRWGLGSVSHWKGDNGENWGKSFFMYWRRTIESDGDGRFQTEILPLLPEAWQKMYRMQGYTVDFVPSTGDTQEMADACDDIYSLLQLVHEGRNPDAFGKLVSQLVREVDSRLPNRDPPVPVVVIERCVHNFFPIGDIVRYCRRSACLDRVRVYSGEARLRTERRRRTRAEYAQESRDRTETLVNRIDARSAMLGGDD